MRKHRSNKERGGPLERRFSLEEEASSTATAHFKIEMVCAHL
jgi:membrane protein YdbS with pleckstrin-like domain